MSALRRRLAKDTGQALVILALGFVVMVAFVGLAADTLLVIVGQARLVRAVDAGALAAASIYWEYPRNITLKDMEDMAVEFVSLNGADPDSVTFATCEEGDPMGLCNGGGPFSVRRRVLVRAEMPVGLAFLRILGFQSVTLTAESRSEAALLDIVLAIDTSESMANDASCNDGDDDDGDGVDDDCGVSQVGDTPDDYLRDPKVCNRPATPPCRPFQQVKERALAFLELFTPPYDRIALVTFDQSPHREIPFPSLSPKDYQAVRSRIEGLKVYSPPPCSDFPPDPSGCTSTNIGGALWEAADELANSAWTRDDAVWVVILLTDGAANTSCRIAPDGSLVCPQPADHRWPNVFCPPSTWLQPFCRDADRSNVGDPDYDSYDWALDMADFVGNNGIVVFAIGMGDLVVNFTAGGEPLAGVKLLRYIAAASDDGDPLTDPCKQPVDVDPREDCGNYFFAPSADDLGRVFSEIADRILTRLVR